MQLTPRSATVKGYRTPISFRQSQRICPNGHCDPDFNSAAEHVIPRTHEPPPRGKGMLSRTTENCSVSALHALEDQDATSTPCVFWFYCWPRLRHELVPSRASTKSRSLAVAARLTALLGLCHQQHLHSLGGLSHPSQAPMPRQKINGS